MQTGPVSEKWGMEGPWQWWRDQMPITRRWAFLDHAAVAPLSHPAAEAVRKLVDQAELLGDTVWPQWSANIERMRQNFAELMFANPEDLFVIPNTSTGISLVAEGFPWQAGDNVIVPEGEFPSNLFPWLNQQSKGVDVRIVPRQGIAVVIDDLLHRVDNCTRIIAVSWVGYSSGYRIDLAELVQRAHERGVLVFLDAIQGLGVHRLNLAEIPLDFLAADGHKWLLGPEGVGIAMIRSQHRPRMRCPIVGWNSVLNSHEFSHSTFQLRDHASRYEAGSANMIGIAALAASVEVFLTVIRDCGVDAIERRVLELANQLTHSLRDLGCDVQRSDREPNQSGIVTFTLPGVDAPAIRKRALERDIVVSCRGGGVRASIHAYNNDEDLRRLVATVQSYL